MKSILDNKPELKKAHKQYIKFTQDDQARELYEAHLKKERDIRSVISIAEQEGIKKEKIETARRMAKEGLAIETISRITSLSLLELKKILK